jgi:diguanylate cyclase (GGDEF)-like protein
MPEPPPLLRTLSEALDALGVAVCAFDEQDRTLLWNRSFLRFFPEHAGHVHAGEPYRENLRRFYEARLGSDELPRLEGYVDEGIARHRNQDRAFGFEHRGRALRVASMPLPGIGRVRIWIELSPLPVASAGDGGQPGGELLDHVPDGVMVTGGDGRIVWANEPFVAAYRLAGRGAAIGLSFAEVYRLAWRGEADQAPLERGLPVLADSLRFIGAPFELPLPQGRWIRVIGQPGPEGRRFYAHVDISELKRQQRHLQLAEQRARDSEARLAQKTALLEATLERMEQGVMMVNAERIVEVCNQRAIDLLGLPPELMGSRPSFETVLAHQWANDEFRHAPQDLKDFVRAGGIVDRPHAYDRQRPDGRVIEVHSVPIEGGGVLRTYSDITERRRQEERIRHLSRHDALTALMNRGAFREQLAERMRPGPDAREGFAVHYIDLDRFKPINDLHGHAVGDEILATLAARMRDVARDVDLVARIGGDEFVILQQHVGHAGHALGLARRLHEVLTRPVEVGALQLQVGASIGVALHPGAGDDPETLLRHADAAMYAAKARGDGVSLHGAGAAPAD